METFAILGFVFGLIALIRTEKLRRNLKQKGILEKNNKEEKCIVSKQSATVEQFRFQN